MGVGWRMQKKVQASLSLCLDGLRGCQGSFATGLFWEVLQRAWAFPFLGGARPSISRCEATAPDVKWSASSPPIWHWASAKRARAIDMWLDCKLKSNNWGSRRTCSCRGLDALASDWTVSCSTLRSEYPYTAIAPYQNQPKRAGAKQEALTAVTARCLGKLGWWLPHVLARRSHSSRPSGSCSSSRPLSTHCPSSGH